jgi:type I restriction enzyme S subunit
MKVKRGYKMTEVGVVPEDWRVESIGKLLDERFIVGHLDGNHGELYPRSHEFKPHGVPYVGANDFEDGHVSFDRCKFLTPERAKQFRKGIGRDGDVLFAHNATVGPVALLRTNEPFVILSTTATYFRSDPAKLNNLYLKAELQSEHFIRQYQAVMAQSTRFQVPITTQRKLSLVIPPLSEQRAIAEALNDPDELLSGLDRLIAKKRDLQQAAMQQLLTGQTRLPGSVGEWEVKQLDEVADVIDPHPSHRAPEAVSNGVPFVGIGDLDESGNIVGTKLRYVDRAVLSEHATRYNLNDQLIGLGRVASIGKVVCLKPIPEGYSISPTLGIIRGRTAKRGYLLYVLRSKFITDQFNRIMSGSTRSSVGMEVLRKLNVSLPASPGEQTAIAEVLTDMDAELASVEQRREKTHALKQAMMQELLTGKTRLI